MTRRVAFISVGVGASQRIPLSVLARNPYKGFAREISHESEEDEGRKVPEKDTVSRRGQSAGEVSQEKDAAEGSRRDSRQERAVKRSVKR